MQKFSFGGEDYILKDRIILKGMEYYQVLENQQTGIKIFLYCYPEK